MAYIIIAVINIDFINHSYAYIASFLDVGYLISDLRKMILLAFKTIYVSHSIVNG